MVPDLVDQHVRHEVLESLIARGPFVEDRHAEQPHALGHGPGLVHAPLGQWNPLVDAAQLERILDPERAQCRLVRELFNQEHDIVQAVGKGPRQRVERAPGEGLDLFRARRWSEGPHRDAHRGLRARPATSPRALPELGALLRGAAFQRMRSGGRVVEGARLESEYTAKPYRGFESLPLRPPFSPPRWFIRA